MKKYEKESIKKSFLLFFSLQFIFISMLLIYHYKNIVHQLDMKITAGIVNCSYTLECKKYDVTYVKKDLSIIFNHLYKDKNTNLIVYFPIKNKPSKIKKISLNYKLYKIEKQKLYEEVLYEFFFIFFMILLLSYIFAKYSIKPIKKALQLNDEFVKDILHDFNTPLSSININIALLKKIHGENDITKRIDSSIDNILSLQDNLNQHLNNSKLQKENIVLNDLLNSRIKHFKVLFPNIIFTLEFNNNINLFTNKDAFTRIIDNIISNSCKYSNLNNSFVKILVENNYLHIIDNGQGIKNTNKIFDRYFKENTRGIGIGLHIVKKLCEKLNIDVLLKSKYKEGTEFIFNLKNIKINS